MIRAFLALSPPDDVRARLQVLQYMLPMPRRVEREDLHLTLAFLGEVSDAVLVAVDDGMVALRMAPFAIMLSGVDVIGGAAARGAHATVAPSEPLSRLQAKVERIARQAGVPIEARRFLPHVTLGRFAPPAPLDRVRLERAILAEAGFQAGPWQVEEVTLYRSWLGTKGPHYQALASYRLA
ncbi:MAG: RNA 2',3'-cyclic phosphodiesterase [Paracoccaceae bacterium]|nr:MAG: RNA 2',3'-cyclic phosphodiesterase [Paracoccaceae bacterium]